MEILLLIIAGVVVYFLYQELNKYLKNPLSSSKYSKSSTYAKEYDIKEDPYVSEKMLDPMEKFANTELGVMLAICAQFPNRQNMQEIYRVIMQDFTTKYLHEKGQDKALYANEIDKMIGGDFYKSDLIDLAKKFLTMSYAEYKKRLRFVEFLLLLVYLDGEIDEQEKEFLLDVAANLELDNQDFNEIYSIYEEKFKNLPKKENNLDEVAKSHGFEDKEAYLKQRIDEIGLNIFGVKNPAILDSALKIREML